MDFHFLSLANLSILVSFQGYVVTMTENHPFSLSLLRIVLPMHFFHFQEANRSTPIRQIQQELVSVGKAGQKPSTKQWMSAMDLSPEERVSIEARFEINLLFHMGEFLVFTLMKSIMVTNPRSTNTRCDFSLVWSLSTLFFWLFGDIPE